MRSLRLSPPLPALVRSWSLSMLRVTFLHLYSPCCECAWTASVATLSGRVPRIPADLMHRCRQLATLWRARARLGLHSRRTRAAAADGREPIGRPPQGKEYEGISSGEDTSDHRVAPTTHRRQLRALPLNHRCSISVFTCTINSRQKSESSPQDTSRRLQSAVSSERHATEAESRGVRSGD
jgi:hypothetical protein